MFLVVFPSTPLQGRGQWVGLHPGKRRQWEPLGACILPRPPWGPVSALFRPQLWVMMATASSPCALQR